MHAFSIRVVETRTRPALSCATARSASARSERGPSTSFTASPPSRISANISSNCLRVASLESRSSNPIKRPSLLSHAAASPR